MLVGQRLAENLVVDPKILEADARLRRAGRSAGLEHEHRFSGEALGNPSLDGAAGQPFILQFGESLKVVDPPDLAPRIPAELRRVLEPERTARRRIEVPV